LHQLCENLSCGCNSISLRYLSESIAVLFLCLVHGAMFDADVCAVAAVAVCGL